MNDKNELTIYKFRLHDPVPSYVQFGHRHFQKEQPAGTRKGKENHFTLPTDLLQVAGIPATLVDEIESITLVYEKK